MRGFQPIKAHAKVKKYANGGPVRGPGTGTSDEVQDAVPEGTYIMPTDSTQAIGEPVLEKAGAPVARGFAPGGNRKVPVNLSNGEFKLPPEQVHAIGVQALNQMKDATHTPVAARGFAPGAQQAGEREPRMFFANGGVVDDENAKRFVKVPDTIGQQPGRQQATAPAPMPAPVSPAPAGNVTGAPGVVRAGNSYEAAPAAPPATAAPGQISPANTFPQASPSAGANVYGGAGKELGSSGTFAAGAERVIGVQPPKPQPPAPVPAVQGPPLSAQIPGYGRSAPVAQQPARGLSVAGAPGVVATGNEYAAAPAQPQAAPARPAAQPAGFSYMDNNQSVGQDIKDSWNKGNYGEAVGKTVAGTVGMFTNPLIDGAAGALEGAKGFGRGLFGMSPAPAAAAPTPVTAVPAANPPAKPAAQAATNAPVAEINAKAQQESAKQPPDQGQTPEPSNTPTSTEVMPGVYRNGNSYGDSAGAALGGAQPRGLPTAQNMAAADALAQRSQQESMARLASTQGAAPGGLQPPTVAHSGNSWSAQNALRNAQVSASSIMNNGGSWDKHKGVSPERAYAAAMENADFAARGAQAGMDQAAMRENAAIQREGMQQAGSTARTQMQEAGQNNRFGQTQGLAQQKFGMEREAQGFQVRAAAQQEQLRNQIMQEQDPAKRQSMVQLMREMQGQTQPSEWGVQVTPATKNVDGSTSMGSVIRFNKATGVVEQVPGQGGQDGRPSGPAAPTSKAEYDALPKGAQYIKDGKVMVKG